jgi:hypothetical protein
MSLSDTYTLGEINIIGKGGIARHNRDQYIWKSIVGWMGDTTLPQTIIIKRYDFSFNSNLLITEKWTEKTPSAFPHTPFK